MATEPVHLQQVPAHGDLNLDHITHYVPDMAAAGEDLSRLGFTVTPFALQSHRLEPGGPLVPAGTGNRCIMLERGYLEFLTPTGESPLASQVRDSIARYVGVHVVAFGTATPDADHARLAERGFNPTTPVALQRQTSTESGEATVRFTVVRVAPGTMPEGRIQFCEHLTPELVWQPRWVGHANGIRAISAVIMCVADAAEAAERYGRYTDLTPARSYGSWRIETARGTLLFVEPDALEATLHVTAPSLPWIAGYALVARDLRSISRLAPAAHADVTELSQHRLLLRLSATLGGIVIVELPDAPPLRFEA